MFDRIRASCQEVARRARQVTIDHDRLAAFAEGFDIHLVPDPYPFTVDPRHAVDFAVTFNAVNFGSGWHPHLRKVAGRSGSRTMMTRLHERFGARGPLPPDQLAKISPHDCAAIFGQDMAPPVDELMGLFAQAWRDLGRLLLDRYDGSISGLVQDAGTSAERLVTLLLEMPLYRDIAEYDGIEVPLLKRAQVTAADVSLVSAPGGAGAFDDLQRLTMFPDNLVPHVLRIEGVLVFAPDLVERIQREELIPSGSPEEVEIRACGVHACELIVDALARDGREVTAMALDSALWNHGQGPRYKAVPRHRTRCPYY